MIDEESSTKEIIKEYKDKLIKESNRHPFINFIKSKADESIQSIFPNDKVTIFEADDFKPTELYIRKYNVINKSKKRINQIRESIKIYYTTTTSFINKAYITINTPLMLRVNKIYDKIKEKEEENKRITIRRRFNIFQDRLKSRLTMIIGKLPFFSNYFQKNVPQVNSSNVDLLSLIYKEEAEVLRTKKLFKKRRIRNVFRMLFSIDSNWILDIEVKKHSNTLSNNNYESIFYKLFKILKFNMSIQRFSVLFIATLFYSLNRYLSNTSNKSSDSTIKPLIVFKDQEEFRENHYKEQNIFNYIITGIPNNTIIANDNSIDFNLEIKRLHKKVEIMKYVSCSAISLPFIYFGYVYNNSIINKTALCLSNKNITIIIASFYFSFKLADFIMFATYFNLKKRLSFIFYSSDHSQRALYEFYTTNI